MVSNPLMGTPRAEFGLASRSPLAVGKRRALAASGEDWACVELRMTRLGPFSPVKTVRQLEAVAGGGLNGELGPCGDIGVLTDAVDGDADMISRRLGGGTDGSRPSIAFGPFGWGGRLELLCRGTAEVGV